MQGGFKSLVNPGTMSDEVTRTPAPETLTDTLTLTIENTVNPLDDERILQSIRFHGSVEGEARDETIIDVEELTFVVERGVLPLIHAFNTVLRMNRLRQDQIDALDPGPAPA